MKSFDELYKPEPETGDARVNDDGKLELYEKDPIKQFLMCIASGATFDSACGYAKLRVKEVKGWLAQGEEAESGSYQDFYLRYKKAQAVFELNKIKAIETAIENGDASKAMWMLERRMAEYYSQKQEVKMGSENLQIKVDIPKA